MSIVANRLKSAMKINKALLRNSPYRYRPKVINCMAVLSFAIKLTLVAFIFPFRALKSLRAATQNSLERMILPINAIKELSSDIANAIITKVIKILSAIGSKTSPITETS